MGSPLVESLVSYIARLAAAHCVSPTRLITDEIAPLVGKRYATTMNAGQRFLTDWHHVVALCGSGPIAREWTTALERLTGWESLAPLTLIHLNRFVSVPTPRTLRRERAWCPVCFDHWRRNDMTPSTPLIWMIEPVTRCPIHHARLATRCPSASCGRTASWRIGHFHQACCPHCDTWLGESEHSDEWITANQSSGQGNVMPGNGRFFGEDEQRQICDVSDVICALLSVPESQAVPTAARMRQRLTAMMSATPPESFKLLRRQTGVTLHRAQAWTHGTSRLSLRQVLGICRVLEISMSAVLETC
jgi:hypothetical protein